jgi:hypothetical protein
MRRARIGLLLGLIPAIASAAYLLGGSSEDAGAPPASPQKIETPQSTPDEPSDDSHSHAPQQPANEVIGVPMFA